MASGEKYTVDVFAKLGGDFKFLRQLNDKGLQIKVGISFNKASGGGFAQLEKYKKGFDVPVNLKLTGNAMRELEKLKKGLDLNIKSGGKAGKDVTSFANASAAFTKNLAKLETQFNKTGAAKDKFISNLKTLQTAFQDTSRAVKSGSRRRFSSGGSAPTDQMDYNSREVQRLGSKYDAGRKAEMERSDRLFKLYEQDAAIRRKEAKAGQTRRDSGLLKYNQSVAPFSAIDAQQKRRQKVSDEFEARMLADQNRQEKLALTSTKLRRADTDRQLKQYEEARVYKARVASDRNDAIIKYGQAGAPFSDINAERNRQDRIAKYNQSLAPFSDINAMRKRESAIAAYNQAVAPVSNINAQRNREAAIAKYNQNTAPFSPFGPAKTQADMKAFRERIRLERAQKEFDRSPSFLSADKTREDIAYNYGLLPGDIKNNKRNFIDARRLDKDTVREAGFAALFGAQHGASGGANLGRTIAGPLGGALGGLAGGALGGGATVAGAVVGGAIGPGGALIGSALAELGVGVVISSLEALAETFGQLSKAGLEFEQSILSIGAVLQATSVAVGPGGEVLPVSNQISIQNARAREIQLASRQKLLPLGIGGEKEVGLVSGTVSGLAQAGIGGASADQIATISSLIGAGLQAQRPDLPTNRIRLGTEEFFSQPNRRTVENVVLSAFAPNVDQATSPEEVISSLAGLAPFVQALTHNSDNAAVAVNKFNAELSNLQISLGDEFLTTITPSIKEFTKALKSDETKQALTGLASDVGDFVAYLISEGAKLTKFLAGPRKAGERYTPSEYSKGVEQHGVFGDTLGQEFIPIKSIFGDNPVTAGISTLLNPLNAINEVSKAAEYGYNADKNREDQDRLNKQALKDLEKLKVKKANLEPSALTSIASLLNEEQIAKGPPALQRLGLANDLLPKLKQQITDAQKGFKETPEFLELDKDLQDNFKKLEESQGFDSAADRLVNIFKEKNADALVTSLAKVRSNNQGRFNENLASGVASRASFEQNIGSQEISALHTVVNNRKREFAETSAKVPENAQAEYSKRKRLADLTDQLAEDEDKLATARVKVRQSVFELTQQKFNKRQEEALSGIDDGTILGKDAGLKVREQRIKAERANLLQDVKSGKIDIEDYDLRTKQLKVDQAKLNREKELAPVERAETFNNAQKALFDFGNLQNELNKTLLGYTIALASATLGIKSAELGIKQSRLNKDQADASLVDFNDAATLRRLENEKALKDLRTEQFSAQGQSFGPDLTQGLDLREQLFKLTGEIKGDPSLIRGTPHFRADIRNRVDADKVKEQIDALDNPSPGAELDFRIEEERRRVKEKELRKFNRDEDLKKRGLLLGQEQAGLGIFQSRISLAEATKNEDDARVKRDQFPIEEASKRINSLKELIKLKQTLPPGTDIYNRLDQAIKTSPDVPKIFGKDEKAFTDFEKSVTSQNIENQFSSFSTTTTNQLNQIIGLMGGKPVSSAGTPGAKGSASSPGVIPAGSPAGVPSSATGYSSGAIDAAANKRDGLEALRDQIESKGGDASSVIQELDNLNGGVTTSFQNLIPNGMDKLEADAGIGSGIVGGLLGVGNDKITGKSPVFSTLAGSKGNVDLASDLFGASVDSYKPLQTSYGSGWVNDPNAKLDKALGPIPSFSTNEVRGAQASLGKAVGKMAKLPAVDMDIKSRDLSQSSEQLVGVMTQVLQAIQNPTGIGAQVNQALRSTFSGGSQ